VISGDNLPVDRDDSAAIRPHSDLALLDVNPRHEAGDLDLVAGLGLLRRVDGEEL